MTQSVIAIYENFRVANHAARDLLDYGFSQDRIQIIANSRSGIFWFHPGPFNTGVIQSSGLLAEDGIGALLGAGISGAAGVTGGLIAASNAASILTALLTVLVWAGAAVLAGGLLGMAAGALIGLGVTDDEAEQYADSVRHSHVLVVVRAESQNLNLLRDILGRYRPEGIDEHAPTMPQPGWMGLKLPQDFEMVFAEGQRPPRRG